MRLHERERDRRARRAGRRRCASPATSSSPNGRSSALEIASRSAAGTIDARGEEQRDDRAASPARSASAPASCGTRRGRSGRTPCPSRPRTRPDPDRADRRRDADRRRALADAIERARRGSSSSTAGKMPWRSLITVSSTSPDCDHLPEDEEDEQRERKQGERQVVGDHRRHPGDVLHVRAVPEGASEPVACRRPRSSRQPVHRLPRGASSASAREADADVAASAPRRPRPPRRGPRRRRPRCRLRRPRRRVALGAAGESRSGGRAPALGGRLRSGPASAAPLVRRGRPRRAGVIRRGPSGARGLRAPGRVSGQVAEDPAGSSGPFALRVRFVGHARSFHLPSRGCMRHGSRPLAGSHADSAFQAA